MRTMIAAVTLASAVLLAGGGDAEAQVFTGPGGPVSLTPGYGYAGYSGYAAGGGYYGGPWGYSSAYVPPYSYYVLPASIPSRVYVGPPQYPFYGKPYGHIYDRWTWPYMSNLYGDVLARYYYPPLGF